MPKCLEKYYKDDWEVMGTFADCYILGKGTERKLYSPKEDRVVYEYTISISRKGADAVIDTQTL